MSDHENEGKDGGGSGSSGPGGGGGNPGHGGGNQKFKIKIDRTEFEVKQPTLTGAQLRDLPKPPIGPDRDLFEVVPGGTDLKIELGAVVEMRDGLRFFTAPAQINPG